jgi:hypothetical protein
MRTGMSPESMNIAVVRRFLPRCLNRPAWPRQVMLWKGSSEMASAGEASVPARRLWGSVTVALPGPGGAGSFRSRLAQPALLLV